MKKAKYLKEDRIRVKAKVQQKNLIEGITNEMKLKDGGLLNFDSFKTEFSRSLKAELTSWSTLSNRN